MKKNTSSLKPITQWWIKPKVLLLLLLGLFLPFLEGNAQTTVTIGTGTSSNGSQAYPAIFANYYYGNKIQILYEGSELLAEGATANSYINSVAFDVDNLNSVPTLDNFTVKVYITSETNPLGTTAFFDGGNNTTNSIGSYTVTATGWNTLTLTTPILWNGCDNIVVEICSNDSSYTINGNASTNYSSVSGSSTYVRWYRADNTTVCSAATGPDTSTNRPNIQLELAANTANCGYVCDFEAVAQSSTTIDLSWTGTGTSYEIEYGLEGFTLGTGTTITTTNLAETLNTLSANTTYDIYIEQICSSGSTAGAYGPVKVTTLCGVVSDFYEDFDTTPTGSSSNPSVPSCWSYIGDIASSGYGYTNSSSADSRSPNNFFRFYRTNSTGNASQSETLISPETNDLGNGTKQVRFYARSYSSSTTYDNSKLEVVTMDDNTSSATVTVLTSYMISGAVYNEYIVPLPATTDDYFGFRIPHNGGTSTTYVYIDDVYYEDLEDCFFPTDITVTNIGQTTADVSWIASIDPSVTQYEYEIRTSGDPDSGSTGLVDTGTTSATTVTLTTLSPSTNYTVYVRSVCGTDTGRWNPTSESFNTLCGVMTGDFYEGFESFPVGSSSDPTVPLCWTNIDDIATTGYSYIDNTSGMANTGTKYYRFYRSNTSANASENLMLISPETDDLGNGAKRIRFSVRAQQTSYLDNELEVLTADTNTATATLTLVETISVPSLTYSEHIVNLPITTDDYFVFRLAHTSGSYSNILIDDIYYEDIPDPTIEVITVDNLCFGGNAGMASVVVTDGAEPFTYEWLPSGGNSFNATGLTTGTYTITVTDALNRSVTDTITISEPDELLSNITYDNISCNGNADGSATINPSGGVAPYTVLWSTGDTEDAVSNLTAGTYSVTITDANGCEVTEDFEIIEPDVLEASIGAQTNVTTYLGNDGSATVDVTGGTLPYTYSWSPSGGTDETASNLTAGTYTVTVTDAGGCMVDQTFVITQPIPLMVSLVSKTDVTCFGGNDGQITVDVIGDHAPYTLAWSPSGGTGYTASNLTAGTYTVLVTNAIGETVTDTYTITEPSAMTVSVGSIVNVSCNGNNNGSATVAVLGGTAPYSYTWSNGETGSVAVNLTAGNHFVHVADANGCAVQESFTVGQPSAILINTVSLTNVSCNGQADGAITIAVNGGITPYTYSWSNGQTGTSLSNLSGGSYTVTVTDGSGCSEQKTFTVAEPAFVYPPSAVNQGFCSDDNPQLADMVITGSNIQWYDAATGGNLLPTTTALTNGTTYYASQTVGVCESTSRTAVQVSLYQSTPLTSTTKDVCYNSVIQDVTIDGFNYTQLKWYSNATSTTALAPTTLLTTATYYISSFTNTVCESARQAVQITVAQSVPAPVVTPQQVCGSGNTLDDLTVGTAAGATLIWYASAQAATPLPGTAQALSGTYYVEQVIGTCKSVRVAVPVQVIPVTSPAMTDLTTCSGTTIADFNAQVAPTKYVWYINNTTTTPLAETTLISSGTFYIAEEVSGCISNRAQVDVVVNQRPNSPTGQTVQRVDPGSTVADLQMNQPGVVWFGSEADALAFTKQLPSNTPLVHNKKYYAVLVGGNNCASLPTEVEVIIVLSTNNLDLTYLKYYPNPTDSELNISYVEAITKVEIFNIAGQKVLSKEFDANEVKVDLSGFGSGTYMVRIETETASQFVKVVKK